MKPNIKTIVKKDNKQGIIELAKLMARKVAEQDFKEKRGQETGEPKK